MIFDDGVNKYVFALQGIRPNAEFILGKTYESLLWLDKTQVKPTEQEFNDAVASWFAAEPMLLLRVERNQKLVETDWMANKDVTLTTAWKNYRQALRDLPTTAEPKLDENGNLTNITWPEKPGAPRIKQD